MANSQVLQRSQQPQARGDLASQAVTVQLPVTYGRCDNILHQIQRAMANSQVLKRSQQAQARGDLASQAVAAQFSATYTEGVITWCINLSILHQPRTRAVSIKIN